jgi:hypothetical protein
MFEQNKPIYVKPRFDVVVHWDFLHIASTYLFFYWCNLRGLGGNWSYFFVEVFKDFFNVDFFFCVNSFVLIFYFLYFLYFYILYLFIYLFYFFEFLDVGFYSLLKFFFVFIFILWCWSLRCDGDSLSKYRKFVYVYSPDNLLDVSLYKYKFIWNKLYLRILDTNGLFSVNIYGYKSNFNFLLFILYLFIFIYLSFYDNIYMMADYLYILSYCWGGFNEIFSKGLGIISSIYMMILTFFYFFKYVLIYFFQVISLCFFYVQFFFIFYFMLFMNVLFLYVFYFILIIFIFLSFKQFCRRVFYMTLFVISVFSFDYYYYFYLIFVVLSNIVGFECFWAYFIYIMKFLFFFVWIMAFIFIVNKFGFTWLTINYFRYFSGIYRYEKFSFDYSDSFNEGLRLKNNHVLFWLLKRFDWKRVALTRSMGGYLMGTWRPERYRWRINIESIFDLLLSRLLMSLDDKFYRLCTFING